MLLQKANGLLLFINVLAVYDLQRKDQCWQTVRQLLQVLNEGRFCISCSSALKLFSCSILPSCSNGAMVRLELVAFPDISSQIHNIGEDKYLIFNIFSILWQKQMKRNKLIFVEGCKTEGLYDFD